ncbi:MAG: AsnC family transcriptional regulator [Candidatus Pacearchaeota archaeon]|jgi:DNA-binding Lrp family transcriptional regulator
MKERKKKVLDGIDKEILRALMIRSPLVTSEIGKIVGLTSSAIKPRLNNLKTEGIIKISKTQGIRVFKRNFGNRQVTVRAARSISWEIDYLENKENKNEKKNKK